MAMKAKQDGHAFAGVSVMLAWTSDGGASFSPEQETASHSCECCRLALAADSDGRPVMVWRQVFPPNIRDHAIQRQEANDHPGEIGRVSVDDWHVDACPHHGPALAIDGNGRRHVAWFSGGGRRKGLFLAHGDGATFSEPQPLGNPDNAPSHPQILAAGGHVWVAWKEFDGEHARIVGQKSSDGGQSWTAPASWAETADASDHPLLLADGKRVFLSWVTRNEGWTLTEVAP
jgi:hypothetical protein